MPRGRRSLPVRSLEQKPLLGPLETFNVFPIRRTSVQTSFGELLEQSAR
jgi:hypothetical protein